MSFSLILIRYFVFLCVIGNLCTNKTHLIHVLMFNAVSHISTCEEETTNGNVINVRYNASDADCNGVCIVKPTFTGGLRFTSITNKSNCHTEVNISDNIDPNTTSIMPCGNRTSIVFNVTRTTVLSMSSKSVNVTAAESYREIRIYQDKTYNETFSVTCGNKTALLISTADRSTSTSGTEYTYQNTTADISSETEHMHLSTTADMSTGTELTTLSTTADIFTGMKHISPTTTDNVSSRLNPVDVQLPDKESDITYIISGVSGVVVIIAIAILIHCHVRRKHPKTDTEVEECSDAQRHNNAGHCDEIPDNPLYHSNLSFDEIAYSTVDDQRSDPPSTRQTEGMGKVPEDETNDVYAKPNKYKSVSAENQNVPNDLSDETVYAQVNKETKA